MEFCQKDFGFDRDYNGFFRELVSQRRKDDGSLVNCFLVFKLKQQTHTINLFQFQCSPNMAIDLIMCISVLRMQTRSI
jgi:hypothetical protein